MVAKNTVLVIDDDPDILELVCFNLEKADFTCLSAGDGPSGLQLARLHSPDLIVLDIMLPDISGTEILQWLKANSRLKRIPVILLTARGETVDRVLGLELGADDYVTKPFSVKELILRIGRILERLEETREAPLELNCGGIRLDIERHRLQVSGRPVQLTTTEFKLLSYLLQNQERVLSRDQLLEHVWGYHYSGTTRTIDTHVQRLRQKLAGEEECLQTIRGIGYRISLRET